MAWVSSRLVPYRTPEERIWRTYFVERRFQFWSWVFFAFFPRFRAPRHPTRCSLTELKMHRESDLDQREKGQTRLEVLLPLFYVPFRTECPGTVLNFHRSSWDIFLFWGTTRLFNLDTILRRRKMAGRFVVLPHWVSAKSAEFRWAGEAIPSFSGCP